LELYFSFHNHSITVRCIEERVIKKLQTEFDYFSASIPTPSRASVNLHLTPPPAIPPSIAHKILETCLIYKIGERTYIDYHGRALTVWDRAQDHLEIYSLDEDRLYELAFLSIHSLLGQYLERSKLCRIHALGVALGQFNALIMLPSKGGKSTLLGELLKDPEINIISDDMPLIDDKGQVHPFPSKISLDHAPSSGPLSSLEWVPFKRAHYPLKWTAGLSQLKARIATNSPQNRTLLFVGLRLSQGSSLMSSVPKWRILKPLLEHMVIGVGLPQVIEMFLHFNWQDLIKLPLHALVRTYCALRLLGNSQCYYLYLGADRAQSAQLILNELHGKQN
jgi:hypothetical protein